MKDLFKIGIFLMGIASIVIATLGILVYIRSFKGERDDFWAVCYPSDEGYAIVVRTRKKLESVEVGKMDVVFGERSSVEAGSEAIFWVRDGGVYEVRASVDGKKITRSAVCGYHP